jgi:prepilin-type N-terminal cleavage/methylation domain-containing protein
MAMQLFAIIRHNTSSAFTIVELLLVIAIIGILTSVILGSLRGARDDGFDAKIKSEMAVLAKRARVEESQNLTFDVVCGSNGFSTSTEVGRLIESIERFSPEPIVCNSDTETFAISAALSSTTYWCIDSVGRSISTTSALGAGEYVCAP